MLKRFAIAVLAVAPVSAGNANSSAAAARAETFAFEHVSCRGAPNEIRIVIAGVEKPQGLVVADLYRNDADGFLNRSGRVAQVRFAAKAPLTRFCIDAPMAGAFAIAAYHDENANRTFDRTALGLPAEHWGISNNPKVRFHAPAVEEALFDVPAGGADIYIQLN